MDSTGGISHAEPGDHSSLIRNYEKGNGGHSAFWEGVTLIVIGLFAMVWLADDGFTVAAWLLYTRRAAAFILPKELLTQEQQLEFRTFLQRA
jgi:hypothetical protein